MLERRGAIARIAVADEAEQRVLARDLGVAREPRDRAGLERRRRARLRLQPRAETEGCEREHSSDTDLKAAHAYDPTPVDDNRGPEFLERSRAQRFGEGGDAEAKLCARRALRDVRVEHPSFQLGELAVEQERDLRTITLADHRSPKSAHWWYDASGRRELASRLLDEGTLGELERLHDLGEVTGDWVRAASARY